MSGHDAIAKLGITAECEGGGDGQHSACNTPCAKRNPVAQVRGDPERRRFDDDT
jgi:hypothetical protein